MLGHVIAGKIELSVDGQTVMLEAGDSYRVPKGAEHTYRILETLSAAQTTAPSGRDST